MVKLVDDGRAILSMRDTDFDTYSAYGEPIDNSVEANARNIRLLFDIGKDGRKEVINELAFVDDGDGMSSEILHRCMQLGYSSRFNERTGIGRFGVGMTLAAIHECKRVEVYSKVRGGVWMHTYTDIDEITSAPPKMENIPDPKPKELPEKYQEYTSQASGTILIWKKYDRLKDTVSKVLEESEIWIGRTYRYFIWDGVNITLNGSKIHAIDPLYVKTSKTKFPDDPKAEEFKPLSKEFKIPEDAQSDKIKSEITIRASLLPKELRSYQGVGGNEETKKRHIDRNEGVSIIRNKREVFYGTIPYWNKAWEAKDRWWGYEISFSAELDQLFAVKNIKRGALPVGEMKNFIQGKMNGFQSSMRDRISDYWKEVATKKEEEEKKENTDLGISDEHTKAVDIAKETPKKISKTKSDKSKDEAIDEFIKKFYDDYPKDKLQALIDFIKNSDYVIDEKSWDSPNFVNIEDLSGSKTIIYNRSHPFFKRYLNIRKMISKMDSEDKAISEGVVALIDLLIISFSIAESQFDKDDEMYVGDFLDDLMIMWGSELQNLFRTWERKFEE